MNAAEPERADDVPCFVCRTSGTVTVHINPYRIPSEPNLLQPQQVVCHACGGAGKIPVEVFIGALTEAGYQVL